MYTDAFRLNARPAFCGSLHVAVDVTTNPDTHTHTHECMYAHGNIVTQVMSAGSMV